MPSEMLNRLEIVLPKIEASIAKENIGSSTKTERLETLESEMRAMKFIWNLPIISIDYLYEDEKTCGLCDRKYDDAFRVCAQGESPAYLPCGHIAGHQCLRRHLSPYESGSTKCPFLGCNVDFPQMYTDSVEPAQPISEIAWEGVNDHEYPDDELSQQISQLSADSGASSDEIKRFLSIDEVLERSRNETEGLAMDTEVRDFATEALGPPEIGEKEFPKDRRMGGCSTPCSRYNGGC